MFCYKPTMEEIKDLQQLSNRSLLDCKAALISSNGNKEKALEKLINNPPLATFITRRDEKGNIIP
ncbi:hypothetical protein R3O67_32715 [Bacillus cereus]|uniref:hypothetical protein n=1 Tax=Bacillus cereus TaxID=1396 RepID=UPI00307AA4CA